MRRALMICALAAAAFLGLTAFQPEGSGDLRDIVGRIAGHMETMTGLYEQKVDILDSLLTARISELRAEGRCFPSPTFDSFNEKLRERIPDLRCPE